MNIYVVRHGIAEEKEEFSKKNLDDRLRPLTEKGKKRVKEIVDWFKDYQDRIDVVLSSPYTRAQETAEFLQKRFKKEKVEIVEWLTPSTPAEKSFRELQAYVAKKPQLHDVVLVGHEPHLSEFISHCLTGNVNTQFEIKKGSITAMSINIEQLAPRAKLLWMVHPKFLLD